MPTCFPNATTELIVKSANSGFKELSEDAIPSNNRATLQTFKLFSSYLNNIDDDAFHGMVALKVCYSNEPQ